MVMKYYFLFLQSGVEIHILQRIWFEVWSLEALQALETLFCVS